MTNVCPKCFNDEGLRKRIIEVRPEYANEKCTFHPRLKGIPIAAVTEIVDTVFRQQYGLGDYSTYDGEQAGDPLEYLVGELTRAEDDGIAKALADQLIEDDDYWPPDGGEAFYADDQNYATYDHTFWHHSELWSNFCRSIVHDQRFFNAGAKELITEIFDGLQFQRDHQKRPPIYEIRPGDENSTFYRARVAERESQLKSIAEAPERELGPPPERLRRAGRMNPAGVGCLYAAYDFDTCIAELRPPVGSTVVGARFALTRPIYVLDTTRFEAPMKPLSVFSRDYMTRVEQWSFMTQFCQKIAKPVSPHDEHLDYIPTQAVAEYFLHHHSFKRKNNPARIEAIIFQSAQFPPGRNIVLLGDAAQVTQPRNNPGKKQGKSTISEFFPDSFETFLDNLPARQKPGIRVIDGSVEVRRVTGAHYISEVRPALLSDEDIDF